MGAQFVIRNFLQVSTYYKNPIAGYIYLCHWPYPYYYYYRY